DALTTTYVAFDKPVYIAPAMNNRMYAHPTTQANLEVLRSRGVQIIDAETGFLACGTEGKGRMAEPSVIVSRVVEGMTNQSLKGCRILITAGPTYERIDPVRFIGNFSTGKMGFALAEACAARGAEVTLVAGPVSLQVHHPNIERIDVTTAEEMYTAATSRFATSDGAILCAAVADFTPRQVATSKLKRKGDDLTITLQPTHDIAAALGQQKTGKQFLVGFALETDHEEQNAEDKMKRKNFDFIVLNSLRDPGAGFGYDTNKITIISADGTSQQYPLKTKQQAASDIVEAVAKLTSGR
ncbi:MAG: bifunctional phosphopantothenoylcysteine decarboxylase/phosphopantothenate--cysteine ligase CoaBC, partial [Paludibacteraceae bacterium]|nr:bifunctional phosphopantothenoylcysteine decarboxylase/phosphopantothenate--cysteine ligase CoaBC [Paludibacteraceae bacterium]